MSGWDAVLVVGFGGPEGPADVMPFLERVTAGRGIPRDRLEVVAEHYAHFGGVSPINGQNRALVEALREELASHGPRLPVYFGNRNWRPLLADTLQEMRRDGVRRALAYVTSAFASYSGCRQYLEAIEAARAEVGDGAPAIDKLRTFHDHPGFVEAQAERLQDAIARVPAGRRDAAQLVFTAHSIPTSMAATSRYVTQIEESCRLVAARVGRTHGSLAWQSRSGPPEIPWLEPDVLEVLRESAARGTKDVVLAPIGFLSDHMEVVWDLDTEAAGVAREAGLALTRAATVGTHPRFVRMIRELVEERVHGAPRASLGTLGTMPDTCAPDCCPAPRRGPR